MLSSRSGCSNGLKKILRKAELASTKLSWLKNLDEFSNPIIVIGKCNE